MSQPDRGPWKFKKIKGIPLEFNEFGTDLPKRPPPSRLDRARRIYDHNRRHGATRRRSLLLAWVVFWR